MSIRRELRDDLDAALGDDPRLALAAVRRLLDDELPWLERREVRVARGSGCPWARIARLLQRSRQAVQQRFAGDETAWLAPPRPGPDPADELDRTVTEGGTSARTGASWPSSLATTAM